MVKYLCLKDIIETPFPQEEREWGNAIATEGFH